MAKIKVIGNAMVITSDVKLKDIKNLEKFSPSSLKLMNDETKEEVFAIGTGSNSFTKFGISFSDSNAQGNAQTTVIIPEKLEDKAKYVKDNYGYALLKLNTLEEFIMAATVNMVADFERMSDSIIVE